MVDASDFGGADGAEVFDSAEVVDAPSPEVGEEDAGAEELLEELLERLSVL